MDYHPHHIRRYRPNDFEDLSRICLQTADSGQDATALFSDPLLPGQVYLAPYVTFEPGLAFVAEDKVGIGGYIVAALDSRAFERRLEQDWRPALRVRYPDPAQDLNADLSVPERYALHDIHYPFSAPHQITEPFPSHLHINLLPRMQGRGIGRQLISTVTATLRKYGSRGVHLLVGHSNQRAVGFYRHIGFTEMPASNVHIFVMNLKTTIT